VLKISKAMRCTRCGARKGCCWPEPHNRRRARVEGRPGRAAGLPRLLGIMGERLAGGNIALALLGNTLATGAILVVLITALGPISGAHFNPAVSAVFALKRELPHGELVAYVLAQIAGGIAGVLIPHGMFDEPLLQLSSKDMTSSQPTIWRSSNSHQSEFGCVLMSPRPS